MPASLTPQLPTIQQSTVEFEHAALKPLILLKGGAIVATLTYIGHEGSVTLLAAFALGAWVCGLVLSVLAFFFGYWSQYAFVKAKQKELGAENAKLKGNETTRASELSRKRNWSSQGRHSRIAMWVACFHSLVCFAVGSIWGIQSLAKMAQEMP